MYNDTNNAQQAKAKRIIREALRRGLLVSVSDGDGDWLCTRPSDELPADYTDNDMMNALARA